MKRKGQIIIGLALILIFILMALAAPVLAPNDPNATNLALKNAPPSAEYPLGCDQMGRCELSRLLYSLYRGRADGQSCCPENTIQKIRDKRCCVGITGAAPL